MKKIKKIKYNYEQLFASKKFNQKYQRDLAKVALGNKLYTIEEATKILDRFFNK